jgi:hypothetical protein
MTAAIQAMYDAKQGIGSISDEVKSMKADSFDDVENNILAVLDKGGSNIDHANVSDCPEEFREAYEANSLAEHNLRDTTKDFLETYKQVLTNPLIMIGEIALGAADFFLHNGGALSKNMPDSLRKMGDKVASATDDVRSSYARAEAAAFKYGVSPNR